MPDDHVQPPDCHALIASMTTQQKVDLLSGAGMWKTAGFPDLDIDPITMTDGTYGVRYSITQIEGNARGGAELDDFLSVVNQRASDIALAWGEMKPATCFPNGSAMGNCWDPELMQELGTLLGRECRAFGVDLLLGPGINIRRTPLAGRSYEYYSEDPLLTGHLSAAVINGLQEQGVGASLKHFACNNSEIERTSMDSVVEERALREIYLRGFETAIDKAAPWTVMSSYNRLNGVQASEDPWLLDQVLRGDWGFEGVVISDWNGIRDRAASLRAGGDLDMPESPARKADLLAAIESGTIPAEVVDRSCARVLSLVAACNAGRTIPVETVDPDAHHARARAMAAQSAVLAKNTGALPLATTAGRLLVVGADAVTPVIQGSGCATTLPTCVDDPLAELRALLPNTEVLHCATAAEAAPLAEGADLILAFVSTEGAYDGEGSDRTTLALGPGQDEMIEALADLGRPVAVTIACPDAVAMPWLDRVDAVLITFYSGQAMGGAVADLVTGRVTPSGKLSVTFPERIEDVPGYLSYPGEQGRHVYSEGIFVGYRGYQARNIQPLFPFGHGLSYTSFSLSDARLSQASVGLEDQISVTVSVTNDGAVAGSEVVQVYLAAKGNLLRRAPQELKGFEKVHLAAGQTRDVRITIKGRDLAVWNPQGRCWALEGEAAEIRIGTSSEDIHASLPVQIRPSMLPWRQVSLDTQPAYLLPNPHARAVLHDWLMDRMKIGDEEADLVLDHCANSFLGFFSTLERRLRISIPATESTEILKRIQSAMSKAEADL